MTDAIPDFPKIRSPFLRTVDERGRYVVTPQIEEGMEWVFGPCVLAVDKLDGTNVSAYLEGGRVLRVANRGRERFLLSVRSGGWESACTQGIAAALDRGMLGRSPDDGWHFGELIGPMFNGNRHGVGGYLWVPFSYLARKCAWRSWSQGKHPKDFETISEWFRELPSIFETKFHGRPPPEVGKAEGLIFRHEDGRMAKLRRDMFPWYEGTPHKEGSAA